MAAYMCKQNYLKKGFSGLAEFKFSDQMDTKQRYKSTRKSHRQQKSKGSKRKSSSQERGSGDIATKDKQKTQNSDLIEEAPVKQVSVKQRNNSTDAAPVFDSGLSSPYSRLQNILTDKEPALHQPRSTKSKNMAAITAQKAQKW